MDLHRLLLADGGILRSFVEVTKAAVPV